MLPDDSLGRLASFRSRSKPPRNNRREMQLLRHLAPPAQQEQSAGVILYVPEVVLRIAKTRR